MDVEELLARADYGPDYEPMASKKLPTSLEPLQPVDEDVYTSTNVLGLDRDAIISAQASFIQFTISIITKSIRLFLTIPFPILEVILKFISSKKRLAFECFP